MATIAVEYTYDAVQSELIAERRLIRHVHLRDLREAGAILTFGPLGDDNTLILVGAGSLEMGLNALAGGLFRELGIVRNANARIWNPAVNPWTWNWRPRYEPKQGPGTWWGLGAWWRPGAWFGVHGHGQEAEGMSRRPSKLKIDPLVAGIISAVALGPALPVPTKGREILSTVADLSVCLVFFVYGTRLHTGEVLMGLTNVKLQPSVLLATYVAFPVFGFFMCKAIEPSRGHRFATGFLYLSILPSTIQFSATFASITKGNVATAVCSATISNILDIFVTPLLTLLALDVDGASGGGLESIVTKLPALFIVGQLLQPLMGGWFQARRSMVKKIGNSSIILIVLSAVVNTTAEGVWAGMTVWTILTLLALSVVLLATMFVLTRFVPGKIGISREDRIVVPICGPKKSLAMGLPMAKTLFPTSMVGVAIVSVVLFHQIQVFVCAIIATRLG